MGNIESTIKNSPKVKQLQDVVNNMTVSYVNETIQTAKQQIDVSQVQNIDLNDMNLTNCSVSVDQQAKIKAELNAVFISLPSSKTQFYEMVANIINTIVDNQEGIVRNFLTITKQNLDCYTDAELKMKLKSIVNINIQSKTTQSCEQSIMVNQKQNVFLSNVTCTDSSININQSAIVNSVANCLFSAISNNLIKDNRIKTSLRQFNGEYNPYYLSSPVDKNVDLPMIFTSSMCNTKNCPVYTDCLECPKCPDLNEINAKQQLTNTILYSIIIITIFITIMCIMKTI